MFTEARESVSGVTVSAAAAETSVCIEAVGVRTTFTVVRCTLVHICTYRDAHNTRGLNPLMHKVAEMVP